MRIITNLGELEFKLTPAEVRLVQAYRNCDDVTQDFVLGIAEDCAERDLLERPKPKGHALRLVQGGAA